MNSLKEISLFDSKIKELEDHIPTFESASSKMSLNTPHYRAQKTKSLQISNKNFFMNTLAKDRGNKATFEFETSKPTSASNLTNPKELTLEDYEKFKQKTIEKHLSTKTKHKGFKKKLKLVLRKD